MLRPHAAILGSTSIDRSSLSISNKSRARYFVFAQFFIFMFSGWAQFFLPDEMIARPMFIFALVLVLIFSPYLLSVITKFFLTVNWPVGIVVGYFFLHPLIVISLHRLGMREFPGGIGGFLFFKGSLAWIINGIIALVIWCDFEREDYESFFKLIWYSGLFLAAESVLTFYIFKGVSFFSFALNQQGRFGSFLVRANFIVGCMGQLFYMLCAYRYLTNQIKKKYLWGLVAGIMLIVSTLERSVIFSFLIFNFLVGVILVFLGWKQKTILQKLRTALFFLLSFFALVAIVILLLVSMRSSSLSNIGQFYDRVMMWLRGFDIAVYYFPVGAGGNMAGKYATSLATVPRSFSLWVGPYLTSDELKIIFQTAAKHFGSPELRRSLHSTQIDLFAEFGLLGFGIVFVALGYPVRLVFRSLKRIYEEPNWDLLPPVIFGVGIFSLQIAMSMISAGTHLFWITAVFYAYSYKYHFPFLSARPENI